MEAENQTNSDQTHCLTCHELIHVKASKCKHCGSFQDWRRRLNLGNTFLALLVALLTVFSVIRPLIQNAFKKDDSELILTLSDVRRSSFDMLDGPMMDVIISRPARSEYLANWRNISPRKFDTTFHKYTSITLDFIGTNSGSRPGFIMGAMAVFSRGDTTLTISFTAERPESGRHLKVEANSSPEIKLHGVNFVFDFPGLVSAGSLDTKEENTRYYLQRGRFIRLLSKEHRNSILGKHINGERIKLSLQVQSLSFLGVQKSTEVDLRGFESDLIYMVVNFLSTVRFPQHFFQPND